MNIFLGQLNGGWTFSTSILGEYLKSGCFWRCHSIWDDLEPVDLFKDL